MKRISLFVALLAISALVGCASVVPRGGISSNMVLPVQVVDTKVVSSKVGKASCVSWFGMVASGDASIEAAAKDGGITKISHVDWKVVSDIPVGIKTIYTTTVYGE